MPWTSDASGEPWARSSARRSASTASAGRPSASRHAAEVEEGPRRRRGGAGGPLEGGQRLLGPAGQHQGRPQEEVGGRVVRRHRQLLPELRDGVVDPGYPLVDQEGHAQVVVGPAHARVLRERRLELGPGAVVLPGVPVRPPDQDPGLRDRPRLPDLAEDPLGLLVPPLGQVGGGQGERQLQVVGHRRPGGLELRHGPLGMARREVGLGQEAARRGVPRVLLHEAGQVLDGRVDPAHLQLDDGPCLDRASRLGAVRRGAPECLPRLLQPSLRRLQPAPEEPPLEEHGAVAALRGRQVPPLQARFRGRDRGVEAIGRGALPEDGNGDETAQQQAGESGA